MDHPHFVALPEADGMTSINPKAVNFIRPAADTDHCYVWVDGIGLYIGMSAEAAVRELTGNGPRGAPPPPPAPPR